jgi:alpha-beta hydrolase superfamily lysophospholipase
MRVRRFCGRLTVLMMTASCVVGMTGGVWAQTRETVTIRGQTQSLRVYGTRGGVPVIVSSGDGGWIHLGPHVAEVLAAKGFFVVGFDIKAYLERFTSGTTTLRQEDEPGDFKVIADFAAHGTGKKPILIGVSEGAGLSVLAATDPRMKKEIAGVIGLGMADVTELGWRWKDALIYLTHDTPKEPTFRVSALVDRVAPVPLGAIHSTHDEFVPLAQVQDVLERAKEPKKLWIIKAADHRFSNNLPEFDTCLLEAITWITQHSAK